MTSDILDSLAKPPPPPSELDELMMRDPLALTSEDIDKIIAYQRQARAQREAPNGGRRRKSDLVDMSGQALDLSALGLVKPTTPAPKPAGGGFRRL